MAKITAVIDIGSNSLTLVIYKKTSRFAFYQLHREKYKIKIGEGSYDKDSFLQPEPMQRAYEALRDFSDIIRAFKARKTLCVATSALRDAPNKKEFIKRIDRELGIKIKVIDGEKESFLGAISAINLLPNYKEFTTIDIGGGSTEFAKVVDGKVVKSISLQLGHVRVSERFLTVEEKKLYIESELEKLKDEFNSDIVVTIGGTAREIAKYIQKQQEYSLYKCLHAYEYDQEAASKYINKIIQKDKDELKKSISKSRIETIKDGALILSLVLKKLKVKTISVNQMGVREGVYLSDLLRNQNLRFPHNFKLNQRVLLDRFLEARGIDSYLFNIANKLVEAFEVGKELKQNILFCSKVLTINNLNFYSWITYLNFGYTHKEKVTIAYLMNSFEEEELSKKLYKKYRELLGEFESLELGYFILKLTSLIGKNLKKQTIMIDKDKDDIIIKADISLLTLKEIEELENPTKFNIKIDHGRKSI